MKKSVLYLFFLVTATSFSIEWEKGKGYMHTQFDHKIHDIGFLHNSDSFMVATTYDLRWFDEEGDVYYGIKDTLVINKKHEKELSKFSISKNGKYYLKHNTQSTYEWILFDSVFNAESYGFIDTFGIFKLQYEGNIRYFINFLNTDFSDQENDLVVSIEYGTKTVNPYGTSYKKENDRKLSFDGKYKFLNEEYDSHYDSHPDGTNSSHSLDQQSLLSSSDTLMIYKSKKEYKQIDGSVSGFTIGVKMEHYAFDPQNKYFVSTHEDSIYLYSLNPIKLVKKQHFHLPVHGLGFTPDGENVIIASDSTLYFWDHTVSLMVNKFYVGESLKHCLIMPNSRGGKEFLLSTADSTKLYKIDHKKIKKIIKSDFTIENNIFQTGDSIKFENTSIGKDLTYEWDFGDGNTSSDIEPYHIYSETGFYYVSLKVKNEDGEDVLEKTNYIEVRERLIADFEFDTKDIGDSVKIECYNTSTGYNIKKVVWNIFDGNEYKGDTITAHINKQPGKTYHIKLKVSNDFFTDSMNVKNAIEFPIEQLNLSVEYYENIDFNKPNVRSKQVFTDTTGGYNIVSYKTEDSLYIERLDDSFEREWKVSEHFGYGTPSNVIVTSDKKIAVSWEDEEQYLDYNLNIFDSSGNVINSITEKGEKDWGNNILSLIEYFDNNIELHLKDDYNLYVKRFDKNMDLKVNEKNNLNNPDHTKAFAEDIIVINDLVNRYEFRYYKFGYMRNLTWKVEDRDISYPPYGELFDYKYIDGILDSNICYILFGNATFHKTILKEQLPFSDTTISTSLTKSYDIDNLNDSSFLIAGSRNDSMTVIKFNYKTGKSEDFLKLNRYGYITDIDMKGERILLTGTLTKNSKETGLYQLLINPNDDPGVIDSGDDDTDDTDTTENEPDIVISNNLAYPNPVIDETNIKIEMEEKATAKTELFDVKGIRVLRQTDEFEPGKQTINLNTSELEPGIYYYIIKSNGRIVRGKMVKVRN